MSNYVTTIESRDGTEYELRASVASITASAVTLGSDEQPTVTATVADDSSIAFAFGIPAGDASASQAAAATALAAASSATNAAASANSAATSATNAATNATNAATSANSAAESANTAATNATRLSNAAITACETATTNANAATTSANDAAAAATTATSAANAATSAANSATTAANTAATEAGNLELAMDASGNVTVTNSAGTSTTNTAIPDAVALATSATSAANSAAGSANDAANTAEGFITTLQGYLPLDSSNILHKATAAAAIASVDDAWPSKLLGLTAYGNSTQDGTPTPAAPVAIKSVAGASVLTSGKNMLHVTATSHSGGRYTIETNGVVKVASELTSNVSILLGMMRFSANVTYTLSVNSNTIGYAYLEAGSVYKTTNGYGFVTFTPQNEATFGVYALLRSTAQVGDELRVMVEVGSTATAFKAYTGGTYPLTFTDSDGVAHVLRSLPDGTADTLVLQEDGTGILTQRVGSYSITGFSSTVYNLGNGAAAGCYFTPPNAANMSLSVCVLIENAFYSSQTSYAAGSFYGNPANVMLVQESSWTRQDFIDAYTGKECIYPLATPQTFTIPAVNMPQLPATVSNAWLSATDEDSAAIAASVGIDYRQDVCVVRDQLVARIAALESA